MLTATVSKLTLAAASSASTPAAHALPLGGGGGNAVGSWVTGFTT